MARTSFRIRRDTATLDPVGVGSFARGSSYWQGVAGVPGVLQDNDRTLRSNDFIVAFETAQESTFDATAVDYDTVQISWALSEAPVNESTITTSGLIGLVVRYSPFGFPESAIDGQLVFSDINPADDEDLGNKTIFHTGAPEGRWAYYTLFGRYYQNGGGYWYEKFASVEALVPNNYGSTMEMWKRIPQYYRERDSGDLYRFLDVFGFEADRTKTLMRSVYMSFSPELAEAEGVEQLAKLVGLEIGVEDLGVSRIRSILKDIGFLRQRKGTLSGVVGTLQALSGADASFEYDLINAEWVATIHAQRANLIGNPRFIGPRGATWDIQGSVDIVADNSSGILNITNNGSSDETIALISKVSIPLQEGVTYYMSARFGDPVTDGITVQPIPDIEFFGVSHVLAVPPISVTIPTTPVEPFSYLDGRPVLTYTPTGLNPTVYPILFFEVKAGETIKITEWMLEPYKYGEYFDGSSDFGGFLYQYNFNDFRWTGTENGSYSTLVVQRKRTEEVIKKIFSSILPVNLPFDPETQIRYDWVPGKI